MVSFEYQIADAKLLAAYTLAMIFLKCLLIFFYSECGYVTLFFEEFKVDMTTSDCSSSENITTRGEFNRTSGGSTALAPHTRNDRMRTDNA